MIRKDGPMEINAKIRVQRYKEELKISATDFVVASHAVNDR